MDTQSCQSEELPQVVPNRWQLVPLGDVLTPSEEWIDLKPDTDYQEVTVKLWGKGVILRRQVKGTEVAAKKRLVVHKEQFILSRIDARNGAFGLIPGDLDGAIVSNDFPVFSLAPSRIVPEFLAWMSKTQKFVEICKSASEGTTNRVRLKGDRFLATEIPLPPLDEQRRIVTRIEALAARIKEVRRLRGQADSLSATLYEQARDRVFQRLDSHRRPVRELFTLINGRAFKPHEWGETGRKIVRIQNLKYQTARYNRYAGTVDPKHLIQSNDVLFAWSGQVVSLGAHVWHGEEAVLNQHIFNVKPIHPMLPRFVQEGFNALINQMKDQVRGLEMFHIRKQEIDRLLFPDSSLPEQRSIVAYLDNLRTKVDELKRLQAETAAELDALLPSILDKAFKGEL